MGEGGCECGEEGLGRVAEAESAGGRVSQGNGAVAGEEDLHAGVGVVVVTVKADADIVVGALDEGAISIAEIGCDIGMC